MYEILPWVVTLVAVVWAYSESQARHIIAAAYEHLLKEARYDSLTDLLNRRGLTKAVDPIISQMFPEAPRPKRRKVEQTIDQVISVVQFDLNNFKKVNDTHGHHMGDVVLEEVAKSLRKHFRETDFLARLGGDEFAIVAPGLSRDEMWERLKGVRMDVHLVYGKLGVVGGGISAGCYEMRSHASLSEALDYADKGLYEEKAQNPSRSR